MPDGQLPEQSSPMDEVKLLGVIGQFEQESYGFASGELANQRAYAIERYLGLPFGDEVEGRSSVVSTDLRDTIEWVLPQILRVFLSGDEVVKFNARGPEDENAAELETQFVNYVILERNDAFNVFSTWFRDALMSKVGYVKAYWQTRSDIKIEMYQGLRDDELAIIAADPSVQIASDNAYPDPYYQAPPQQMPAAQGMQSGMMPGQPQPHPMLHDVQVRRTYPCGHVKIDNVPPEEIYIHRSLRTIGLDDCVFIQHRTQKTLSELRQEGYDVGDDLASGDSSDGGDLDEIGIARDRFSDALNQDYSSVDPATRTVWVKESYVRVDYDGDGVAELRKVCHVGNTVLTYQGKPANEEADLIPFAAITPIVFPHRHIGIGFDDLCRMPLEVNTAIMRQFLDNLYLANNGRYGVDVNKVNVDDLLVSRPGGIVRTNGNPNEGIMPLTHPQVGAGAMQGLEWVQNWLQTSTGVSADLSNMSPDVLNNSTASGIAQAVAAGQSRVEAVTRSFAAGVKDLCSIVHALTLKNATSDEKVKLNNQWQAIDPREWVKRSHMSITVGLGSGTKQSRIAELNQLAQLQQMGMQAGIVKPINLYNTGTKLSQEMGFKNADEFWSRPPDQPPPSPPPPEIQVEQMRQQGHQQSMQMDAQIEMQKMQAEAQAKQADRAAQNAVQEANDQRDYVRMQGEFQMKNEQHMRELQAKDVMHQREQETAIRIAYINAQAKTEAASVAAAQRDNAVFAQEAAGAGG